MVPLEAATQLEAVGSTTVEVAAAVVLFGGLLLTALWVRALYA